MGKFVKEATAAGLPEDVGKRRYYAHEITRQDAVKTVLAKREEKIHDDAKEKWQRANAKVDIVRQMFDTIDDDGNGHITLEEFHCFIVGVEMAEVGRRVRWKGWCARPDGAGEEPTRQLAWPTRPPLGRSDGSTR